MRFDSVFIIYVIAIHCNQAQTKEIQMLKQERDQLGAERELLARERDQLLDRVRQLEERERQSEERGLGQGRLEEQRKPGPKLLPWSDLGEKSKRDDLTKAVAEMQKISERRDTTLAQVAAHIAYR